MKGASVTIYLTLCLTICLTFFMTTLESARTKGLSAQTTFAEKSALDSLFAEYDGTLFDRYGITFLDSSAMGGSFGIAKKVKNYTQYELDASRDLLFAGGNFYPVQVEELSINKMTFAADYGGDVFGRTVLEFMKYEVVGDLTEYVLKQLNLLKEGESASKEMDSDQKEINNTEWTHVSYDGLVEKKQFLALKKSLFSEEAPEIPPIQSAPSDSQPENAYDEERHKEEVDKSIIGKVEELKDGEFLKLILPSEQILSGKTVSLEDLPSKTLWNWKRLGNAGLLDEIGQNILYSEYVLQFFSCFTESVHKDGLQYEIEYILQGKEAETENLKRTIQDLMWVRSGMNVLSILTNADQVWDAELLADAIVGWTLIPLLTRLTKYVIIAAWAYAEAIVDLRTIMGGGKVPLLKDSASWNLSLSGVLDSILGNVSAGKQSDEGLTYKDYLRLLLLTERESDKYFRTMDMIQSALVAINSEFRMKNCVFAVEVTGKYQARQIFPMLHDKRVYQFTNAQSRMY